MNNTGIVVGVIALVVVVGGGVFVSMNNKNTDVMVKDTMEQNVMEEEKKMMEEKEMMNEEMMKKDVMASDSMMDKGEMMKGSYEAYSSDKLAKAESGDVVLFFHASWCPSCRGVDSSIQSNLGSIPKDLTILKADYDKEVDLKKKYGVTTQHTFVQVDKDGNMLKKWSGGSTLESILSQVQ